MTQLPPYAVPASEVAARSNASIEDVVAAIVSIESTMDTWKHQDDEQLAAVCDLELKLLSKLADCIPITVSERLLKAETAIKRLLRSVEDGENGQEVELGNMTLRDLRTSRLLLPPTTSPPA